MNSPEVIGAWLSGLTALMVAVFTFANARTRRISDEQDDLRDDVGWLQAQVRLAISHIYALEVIMAGRGLPVPERPDTLGDLRPEKPRRRR